MRGFSRVLLLLLPAGWIFAQVSDGKEAGSPNPGRLPRKSAPLVFPTGGSVYRMLKPENFDRCRREVLTLLSGKDEMPSPGVQTSFPVWGSLYAGLVDSGMKKVDGSADSSLYVFGLICAGQLSRAELRGMEFLKKEPENFGLLVLLGALAERNGELFPCLERAIAENPTKTIEILNTLSHLRLISLTRKEEFLDRYLHQLFLHRAEIQRKSLAEWTVFRLQQIIRLQRKRRGALGSRIRRWRHSARSFRESPGNLRPSADRRFKFRPFETGRWCRIARSRKRSNGIRRFGKDGGCVRKTEDSAGVFPRDGLFLFHLHLSYRGSWPVRISGVQMAGDGGEENVLSLLLSRRSMKVEKSASKFAFVSGGE